MFSRPMCSAVASAVVIILTPVIDPALATIDPVVAIVNDVEIHRSVIESLWHIMSHGQDAPKMDTTLYDQILDYLINATVLMGEVQRQKLDQDPEFKAQLAEMERRLFQHIYQTRVVENQITDAALQAHYNKIAKDLPEREEIRASHILLSSEAEAWDAIREIKKGADFTEVARQRSIDGSRERGGDLGFLPREALIEPFARAVTVLQPGYMNDQPVRSPFGWHIIKLEERRVGKPQFEDAKEEVKASLAQQTFTQLLAALRAKANVRKIPPPISSTR